MSKFVIMALAWYAMWNALNGNRDKVQQAVIGIIGAVVIFKVLYKIWKGRNSYGLNKTNNNSYSFGWSST